MKVKGISGMEVAVCTICKNLSNVEVRLNSPESLEWPVLMIFNLFFNKPSTNTARIGAVLKNRVIDRIN